MHTVPEALDAVIRHAKPLQGDETVSLAETRGRSLSQPIVSEIDSPPFDKAIMDGFAIRAADTTADGAALRVLETVSAGQVPTSTLGPGEATRIMTGAPTPDGADTVVPIERTTVPANSNTVHIPSEIPARKNILYRGESMRRGEEIFPVRHRLRPQDLAMLAELGITRVPVRPRPRVAVLATGDELVPPDQAPGPGQIRNSNETLLAEFAAALGCEAVPLGIARDEPGDLREKIDRGLECDLLLLSGGVSAGDRDLVPAALAAAGVAEVFHKVNLKPGKPIWFGTRPETRRTDRLVFGLPGNPVSSLVCFEIFVRTALGGLHGQTDPHPPTLPAILDEHVAIKGDRVVYFPSRLRIDDRGTVRATPVPWAGSGDLRATTRANGIVVIAPGTEAVPGSTVPAMVWSGNELDGT